MKSTIGIDEVGRGPLAGPLAVCALRLSPKSPLARAASIRDSKKLSAKKRELIFKELENERKEGRVNFSVTFIPASRIDKNGISSSIKQAVAISLADIEAKPNEHVLLDGALKAPSEFINQQTLIKGDEKEQAIALASIAAKVLRDRKMIELATKYPHYSLETHKGYGTKVHREAIEKLGLTPIHRATFCKNITTSGRRT